MLHNTQRDSRGDPFNRPETQNGSPSAGFPRSQNTHFLHQIGQPGSVQQGVLQQSAEQQRTEYRSACHSLTCRQYVTIRLPSLYTIKAHPLQKNQLLQPTMKQILLRNAPQYKIGPEFLKKGTAFSENEHSREDQRLPKSAHHPHNAVPPTGRLKTQQRRADIHTTSERLRTHNQDKQREIGDLSRSGRNKCLAVLSKDLGDVSVSIWHSPQTAASGLCIVSFFVWIGQPLLLAWML